MANGASPSVNRLAGQLRYLLDDRPELQTATVEQLRDRLGREDRAARARARYPGSSDEVVAREAAELDDRITLDAVAEAMRMLTAEGRRAGPDPGATAAPRRDDTPRLLFVAAIALWTAGLAGWIANLAVNGLDRSTWTGGALLVVMGAAVGGALASHREGAPVRTSSASRPPARP